MAGVGVRAGRVHGLGLRLRLEPAAFESPQSRDVEGGEAGASGSDVGGIFLPS